MKNNEGQKIVRPETIENPDLLSFRKDAESLKFLYLMNKMCLPAIAEDFQEAVLELRDGKILQEILVPLFSDIKSRWDQLIIEGKLSKDTVEDANQFANLSDDLVQQMKSVNSSTQMTEEDREKMQDTVRAVINVIDKIIAPKSA